MQHDGCIVGFVDGRRYLNVLTSLHQSICIALQALSDHIRVRYISQEDGNLFSAPEIIMHSGHNDSISPMFRRDTRFIDRFHCIMNYDVTFRLE